MSANLGTSHLTSQRYPGGADGVKARGRIVHMRGAPTDSQRQVVLSPHLDDAALSAWHVLGSGGEALVVTVFAGIPASGFVTALDRARGGRESAAVVRQRRREDRAALALAGRTPTHLELLDIDYRAFARPEVRAAIEHEPSHFIATVSGEPQLRIEPDALERHIAGLLTDSDVVYAPAGVGAHPDHRDVARLGTRLASQGRPVRFYADIPYLFRHGWPSWLGGAPGSQADRDVEEALAELASPAALTREVFELDHAQVATKAAAIRRYETEFDLVNADFGGVLEDLEHLRCEVVWTMPA
jgi:LmbE family N-acetylglucosaminyl deacetylase